MNADLEAAQRRVQLLEAQVLHLLSEAERVRNEARNLSRAQQQLQQELFLMHRRVDNSFYHAPTPTASIPAALNYSNSHHHPHYNPHEVLHLGSNMV